MEPVVDSHVVARCVDTTSGRSANPAELGASPARMDLASFNDLVQVHQILIFNICLRILRDGQAAEDATQETFIGLAALGRLERACPPLAGAGRREQESRRVEKTRSAKFVFARHWASRRLCQRGGHSTRARKGDNGPKCVEEHRDRLGPVTG